MKLLYTPRVLFNAAALVAFGSSIAFAQDTSRARPRSSQRIPISKEAPGEVAMPKTDTVTVYRTDTLRVTSPPTVDTVRMTNTVTRVDTVMTAPPMRPVHLPGGLYLGLGGGVTAPNGAIFTPNSAGPTAQLQVGWQGAKNPLGLRIDANWAKPGEDSYYAAYQADPDIVNVNGDVKLDLPIFNHLLGVTPRFKLYALGGGSYITYKNLPIRSNVAGAGIGPANVLVGDTDWQKHWGWNAGGGASVGFSRTEIFAETRVIAWTTNVTPQARQMPFVLGVNIF